MRRPAPPASLVRKLALPGFALFSLGCGSPTLGELATDSVTITLTGIASDTAVASLGEPAERLGVTRLLVASTLSVIPCQKDAETLVLSARGFDLLKTPAPFETISTAVTKLCGLRLDIDPVELDNVPEGVALELEATDAAGAKLSLSSGDSMSLLLAAEGGSSFGDLPLLVGFDVSLWLKDVPLEAELSEKALELFTEQTRSAIALYVDANGNHALDESERTPVGSAQPAR